MTTPMTWPGCGAKFVRDNSAEDKTMTEQEQIRVLRDALTELYATVKGECPSLLDEDSGGSEHLKTQVDEALAATSTIQPVAAPEPVGVWLDPNVTPMQPGLVVKYWRRNGAKVALDFSGNPKLASCDLYFRLPDPITAAPAQAAPDEVLENLALVIARLEQIKHISEDNFDVRTFAQEALVCANALRTSTAACAATPADSQKGEGK